MFGSMGPSMNTSSLSSMTAGGGGEEPNYTTARSLVLYKSFSTLWSLLFSVVTALVRRDPLRQRSLRQHGRGGGILSGIFYLLNFYIFHLFFCIFTDFVQFVLEIFV
jgi:hypothetical protein